MDIAVFNRISYQIPSNNILDNRRQFYDLTKNAETREEWFERIFCRINDCGFPRGKEYILTDRFICELNTEELDQICEEDLNWSIKLLVGADGMDDSDELKSCASMDTDTGSDTDDEVRDHILYKIPSTKILENRRNFYGLKKKSTETIEKWFERVIIHADECDFPEMVEYILMDKFISELCNEERDYIRKLNANWSTKCGTSNQTAATDVIDYSDELEPNASVPTSVDDDEMMPKNDSQIIAEHSDQMALNNLCQTAHHEMQSSVQQFQQQSQPSVVPAIQKSFLQKQPPQDTNGTCIVLKGIQAQEQQQNSICLDLRQLHKQQLALAQAHKRTVTPSDRISRHSPGHTKTKLVFCNYCHKKFTQLIDLMEHKKKDHHVIFKERIQTQRRMITHTEERPNACDQCDSSFARLSHLKEHLRIHTGERPHACDQCDMSFAQSATLTNHKKFVHRQIRSFICDKCDYRSGSAQNLRTLAFKHTGERPYTCDQCDKSFAGLSHLKEHLRIHTGERPYACDQCDMSFAQSATLTNHKKFVHQQIRSFVCDKCDYRSVTAQNLSKHAFKHTGDRPYPCDQCDKAFTQTSALDRHKRSVHSRKRL